MTELSELFKDRNRLEQTLYQHQECFLKVLEYIPTGIAIQAGDRLMYTNTAAARLVGLTNRTELLAKSLFDFIALADQAAFGHQLATAAASQEMFECEVTFIQVDGIEVEGELTAIPIVFRDMPATLFTLQTINEQVVTERLVSRYAEIINNMQLGLHVYRLEDPADDHTLRLITANPSH